MPFRYYTIEPGLDPGWRYALNLLSASPYKFGPDVVFTYGPLGFINYPQNQGWNLAIALLVRSFIWITLIASVESYYRRRRSTRPACYIALLALIFVHPLLRDYIDYTVEAGALLLIMQLSSADWEWGDTLLLSLISAVAFLTKESSYVMLVAALAVYHAVASLRERQWPSRLALLRLGIIASTPLLAYLVYNPSLPGLWAYVVSSASIIGGYSAAMSLPGLSVHELEQLGVLTVLICGFGVLATWSRWLKIEGAACVTMALFLTIKQNIIRAGGNLYFVYAFAVILLAILILNCRYAGRSVLMGNSVALICVLSLAGMGPLRSTLSTQSWSLAGPVDRIESLAHWQRSMEAAAAQTQANLQEDRLPQRVQDNIQQDPVVIFPTELSYAPANNLRLFPLYTLQTYAAYTHYLDVRTATTLANSPAQTKLLMEWKGLDNRHPLLDVPATWDVISNNFAFEASDFGFLLLKKRELPRAVHYKLLRSAVADIRQWQDVPEHDDVVSAAVVLHSTFWGTLRNLLYRTEPVYLELEPDLGGVQRYRVVPDVLKQPFVINCLPLSFAGLESFLSADTCTQRIKRFRFFGEGLSSFSPFFRITFAEAPDEPLRFAARQGLGESDAKFPSEVGTAWAGSVDSINGNPLPEGNSPANPLRVARSGRLEIQGWAASEPRAGEAFDGVFLILGKQQFRALAELRADVARGYQNPRLGLSGFQVSIDASTLDPGVYLLRLIGVTRSGSYYSCPNRIYVRFE